MKKVITFIRENILREKVFFGIFNILVLFMFAVLLHYGLEMTGIDNFRNYWDEHIYLAKESVIKNIVVLLISVLLTFFVGKLSVFMRNKRVRGIVLMVSCVLMSAGSIFWVCGLHSVPVGDQKIVFDFASVFNNGEYYGLERGQYIAIYPQQLGLVTLLRPFVKLVGENNYFAFQLMVALLVWLIPFAGTMIVRMISQDNPRVELFYQVFVLTCFPIYGYTAFVYGDLIALPFVMLGIWGYLSCMKKFRVWKLVCLALTMGLAVTLKTNMLIVMVAMILVAIIQFIVGNGKKNLWIAAATGMGVLLFSLSVKAIYAPHYEEGAEGIPASSWIAMGLSDNEQGPGWYNIYALDMFYRADYDAGLANEIAKQDIRDRLAAYLANPEYMVDFFSRKMNTQWNAPMYQSVVMVNQQIVKEQNRAIHEICYRGTLGKMIEKYMKAYQLLMYAGILFLMISGWNRENHLEDYVLLVAVFGGFLFTMIWEAKTRYAFPYLVMMIPYMAMGVNRMAEVPERWKKRHRKEVAPE